MKIVFFISIQFFISIFFFLPETLAAERTLDSTVVISGIAISGNKTTKEHIILRELAFTKGDTILVSALPELIDKSKRNLLNTSLFNFVYIDKNILSGKVEIVISVTERWYTWPAPFFQLADRNFNTWWETKDLSRVDYGIYVTRDNFRGRKESLKAIFIMGYDYIYGFSYKAPYINKNKTLGLGMSASFIGNHEVPFVTNDNKQEFYKDKNSFVQKNIYSSFQLSIRKHIYITQAIQFNFNSYNFVDSLRLKNSNFSKNSRMEYFSISYYFKNDHRDFMAYPLKGYFFDFEAVRSGLGILKNETANYTYIHSSARRFFKLSDRFYFASGINFKLSSKVVQPYFYQHGLGFGGDFVRGYEYYVIDGQNFGVVKTNAKFVIIPTKEKLLKFIPFKKFNKIHYALYLNLYGDAAYVDRYGINDADKLTNSVLYGCGIGVDFVTYYDKVFRLDYSFNKKGESGLFLHFVAPI